MWKNGKTFYRQSYALLEGTNKKSMNNIQGRQYTLRNRVDKQKK